MLINLKKCSFVKKELVYLGFVVSTEGLKMDPEKVNAILEWPTLRSVTKVRYFHGLTSFHRNYTKGFKNICGPMTKSMRGDRKEFNWIVGVDKSFNLLKEKVTEQHILALLDFSKVLQFDYNVSGTTIGAIVS